MASSSSRPWVPRLHLLLILPMSLLQMAFEQNAVASKGPHLARLLRCGQVLGHLGRRRLLALLNLPLVHQLLEHLREPGLPFLEQELGCRYAPPRVVQACD
jgi:hypothetical protein